jgi:hypothetical protein
MNPHHQARAVSGAFLAGSAVSSIILIVGGRNPISVDAVGRHRQPGPTARSDAKPVGEQDVRESHFLFSSLHRCPDIVRPSCLKCQKCCAPRRTRVRCAALFITVDPERDTPAM